MSADKLTPAPRLPADHRTALVVGTSTYRDPEYPPLAAPAHDAATMSRMLQDPDICGFEVRTLIDPPVEDIRLALSEIFDEDRDSDDLVLAYLSCHGAKDRRGRLHLVATDTDSVRLAATSVRARDLMELAQDCPARRQVIILDCCYSGAFDAKGMAVAELEAEALSEAAGLCVITASRGAEYSFQYRPGSGEITGSVFTTAFADGILTGQADVASHGRITVQDAYRFAHAAVRKYGRRQTPQFNIYGAEGASILLARNPVGIRTGESDLYELVSLLDSRHVEVRTGAVLAFGQLLRDENPAKSAAARLGLERVIATDADLADLASELLTSGSRPVRRPRSDGSGSRSSTGRAPSPYPRKAQTRHPEPEVADAAPQVASFEIGAPLTEEELAGLRGAVDRPEGEELTRVGDPLGVFAPRRVVPLDTEASQLTQRFLYPTEIFYAEWRRHWSEPVLAAALSGLASGRAVDPIDPHLVGIPPQLFGVTTSTALTVALVAVGVLAGWRALAWYVWRIVLTNTRILIVRGILWQRTTTIPLQRHTNVRSSRSLLGKLLGYGTLSVSGGRWRSYRIRHLPVPDENVLRITEQVFDPETAKARLRPDEEYDGSE
jgi:hypothetical protein